VKIQSSLKKSQNTALLEKMTIFRMNFHFKEMKSHSNKVRFYFKKSKDRHFFSRNEIFLLFFKDGWIFTLLE